MSGPFTAYKHGPTWFVQVVPCTTTDEFDDQALVSHNATNHHQASY
jgi:hypothetical protein